MAEAKKEVLGREKRKKYRSDGTPIWEKRTVEGPGVRGKEKQTVGELYDLFESLADELWPENEEVDGGGSNTENPELSLEQQIANEMTTMQKSRKEKRFANLQTHAACVVFISCKPPVDPVKLVIKHVENVLSSGVTRTRYTHRLVPVSDTCVANLPEITTLCHNVFTPFFESHGERKFTYKIELRIRNHSTISRPVLIQHIASCVPEGHAVTLGDPEVFILVEVFKSVCGISIVQGYYRFQKFNVMEIANAKNLSNVETSERVQMN